jgi:hypothetical protein
VPAPCGQLLPPRGRAWALKRTLAEKQRNLGPAAKYVSDDAIVGLAGVFAQRFECQSVAQALDDGRFAIEGLVRPVNFGRVPAIASAVVCGPSTAASRIARCSASTERP